MYAECFGQHFNYTVGWSVFPVYCGSSGESALCSFIKYLIVGGVGL